MAFGAVAYEAPSAGTFEGSVAAVPMVLVVPELPEDELVCARAERLIKRASALLLENAVEYSRPEPDAEHLGGYRSLLEAVHAAARGDERARRVIEANAGCIVIEQTLKVGHVKKVTLTRDDAGRPQQHGQLMEDVYVNALRYGCGSPQMWGRGTAETRNGSRIEQYSRSGILEDYYLVVKSPTADNMSKRELDDAHFFTKTMTCVFQATCSDGSKLTTESAFVAGVVEPEAERHDIATIVEMGRKLGVDLSGKNATELIDSPLLIHKSLMPNGVIDLVKLYDECSGLGTFFGQAKPVQDYARYLEYCHQREAEYKPRVQQIVEALIAGAGELHTPDQATELLHNLSQRSMVDYAIQNPDIDPLVFGKPAAKHIEAARYMYAQGDELGARRARQEAQRTARSSSCPYEKQQKQNSDLKEAYEESPDDPETTTDVNTGQIRCIKCRQYVDKAKVEKKDCWQCPKCNHKVDICTGKVINEGNVRAPKHAKLAGVVSILEKLEQTKAEKTAEDDQSQSALVVQTVH